MKNVILASQSPRRKELLSLIYDDFDIVVSNAEEIVPSGTENCDIPLVLSVIKAKSIAENHPDSLVIGADTIVLFEDKVLGKPKSYDEAFSMIKMLSGKTHKVITGCTLAKKGKILSFSVTTDVKFFALSDDEIANYVAQNESYDKAGGYGIQSKGAVLVEKIDGDFYNVVGLPIAHLRKKIKDFESLF